MRVERQIEVNVSHPPLWIPIAFQAFRRLEQSLSPTLARRLERFLFRFCPEERSLEALALSASATPFLFLIEAYRKDLGLRDSDARLALIGEAALAFYLYVRIQDDIVDEPDVCDAGHVYLADVFAGASARAFSEALPDNSSFFAFREQTMRAFNEFAIRDLDERCHDSINDEDFNSIGNKFLPMAVLLGAVAHLGNRADACPSLVRFTVLLGTGLQLINDLLNVAEDHERGAVTPLLRRLYREGIAGREDLPARARWLLLASPVLQDEMSRARTAIIEAQQVALEIGAAEMAAITRERLTYLASIPKTLLSISFHRRPRWD